MNRYRSGGFICSADVSIDRVIVDGNLRPLFDKNNTQDIDSEEEMLENDEMNEGEGIADSRVG